VRKRMADGGWRIGKPIGRIILDSMARTPLDAKVVSDEHAALTTIIVSKPVPKNRAAKLASRANMRVAPSRDGRIDLRWLLKKLGSENVTSLLVEGGGEVNASFLLGGLAQRTVFFYAPKILGGRDTRKGVAGEGAKNLAGAIQLREVEWRKIGEDLLLTARVD
jgi:diaminohydroxyphosphoribosylaminopyrimidine deaminase / 5-amino-6-(5-phosphoribosylamino)uracil reductase